jgi:hypothetical protein
MFQVDDRMRGRIINFSSFFGLFLAIMFFAYRFNNWIILGKVDIPAEISI